MDKATRLLRQGQFEEYINEKRAEVAEHHHLIPSFSEQKEAIIDYNSPYLHHPLPEKDNGQAVLLVHGLLSCCYATGDIAKHLVDQGYTAYGILLPGHGTSAQRLKKIKYPQWVETVEAALQGIRLKHKDIIIVGISLGAAMALNVAVRGYPVKGLILFSPAFALFPIWSHLFKMRFIKQHAKTLYKTGNLPPIEDDICCYNFFSIQTAQQASSFFLRNQKLLKKEPLLCPQVSFMSLEDETVDMRAYLKYLETSPHHRQSRFFLYQKTKEDFPIDNLTTRISQYPEENIIGFSHVGIQNAPDNPHYGKNGFIDYHHYNLQAKDLGQPKYFGAIIRENIDLPLLARLRYNPDFARVCTDIDSFLTSISEEK